MQALATYPHVRLRRLRSDPWSRRLVAEQKLSVDDLILPVFVIEGTGIIQPVAAMPGVNRYSVDTLVELAKDAYTAGINAITIFPFIDNDLKTEFAEEAYNPAGLVPRAIKQLKAALPDLGIITDVALDPYTSHGQDGLIDARGYVLNDVTVEVLAKQALCHAQAGADIVAPSDMMDGRVLVIRQRLEAQQMTNTKILSYAAKYASAYYSPFRDAVGSADCLQNADKHTYQMHSANIAEALREVALDINEGADIVMIKTRAIVLGCGATG